VIHRRRLSDGCGAKITRLLGLRSPKVTGIEPVPVGGWRTRVTAHSSRATSAGRKRPAGLESERNSAKPLAVVVEQELSAGGLDEMAPRLENRATRDDAGYDRRACSHRRK